jgi:predicted nucleic acid-binding protein
LILVDTSIWIDHIRSSNRRLVALLDAEQVNVHPWVTGELACGNLADRTNTLYLLRALPQVQVASEDEVLFFIDKHRIAGKGIGYLDMHLLAAAALGNLKIWTRDKRLSQIASFLGLNAAITP